MNESSPPVEVASSDQLGPVTLLRQLRDSLDSDDWMGERRMIEVVDEVIGAVQALHTENTKSERRAITFGDIVHQQVIAMRAAVVAAKLEGLDVGMQWIANTLCGPGHLPDLDEAKALGGAQALWDKETAEHDAFRAAHPAP